MTGTRRAAGVLGVTLGLLAGVGPAAAHPATARGDAGGGIEGFVFLDSDADGRLDPDETGVRIVPIRLEGPVNRTVLSTMNGAFRFEDLPPGTYDVAVEPGAGWQSLSQAEYAGLSVDGDRLQNVNFALRSVPVAVGEAGAGSGEAEGVAGGAQGAMAGAGEAGDVSPAAMAAAAGLIGAASDDTVDAATLEAALDAAQAGAIDQPVVDVLAQALAAVSEASDVPQPPAAGPAGVVVPGAVAATDPRGARSGADAADAGDGAGVAAAAPPVAAARAAGPERPGMPQTGTVPGGTGVLSAALGLIAIGAAGLSIERVRRPAA